VSAVPAGLRATRAATIAFAAWLIAGAASGADLYVAPWGSETHPGTLAAPFATVQRAIDRAAPGDTVYLRAGDYHEEVVATGPVGAPGQPVVLRNFEDEPVTFDGTVALPGPWEPFDLNGHPVYRTTVSQDVWQLFVDGRMMVVARWPNVTAGHPTDPFEAAPNGVDPKPGTWWDQPGTWARGSTPHSDSGEVVCAPSSADLAATGLSFAGGSIVLNHGSELTWERAILSHAAGSNTLFHDPVIAPHDQGEPFFVVEHLNALDQPGEWYFARDEGFVYLWPEDGASPEGREVRGKVQAHALKFVNCQSVELRGLRFFATTLDAVDCSDLTVVDSWLSYPTAFPRMLGVYGSGQHHPYETRLTGTRITVRNTVVEYTEGKALDLFQGEGNVVENSLFHHIDFYGLGQLAIDMRKDPTGRFERNTFHTGGASAMLKHWEIPVRLNRVSRFGYLQQDGAAFQVNSAHTEGAVRSYNWVHHNRKYGGRWDGYDGQRGVNHHNVGFQVEGAIQAKGDDLDTHNNTALEAAAKNDIIVLDENGAGEPRNQLSRTWNNLADRIAGDRKDPLSLHPIPGTHANNWNGYVTGSAARSQLRDVDNFDFRPREGAAVIDAGRVIPEVTDGFLGAAPDIGAYEFGDPHYWIPGRQLAKASSPIPPLGTTSAKPNADLMWLEGLGAAAHRVSFSLFREDVEAGQSPIELAAAGNVVDPGPLQYGTTYSWRVDAVSASGDAEVGDVWSFTTEAAPPIGGSSAVQEFVPVADAYVDEEVPNSNFGSAAELKLLSPEPVTTRFTRHGYVRFDVSVPGPIERALLLFERQSNYNQGLSLYGVSDTSWDEQQVTWLNRPPIDGPLLNPGASDDWDGFDVTAHVTGNGLLSFGLIRGLNNSQRYLFSRESATPPRLVVTYEVEPANQAPSFASNPYAAPEASVGRGYAGSLAAGWVDPDGDAPLRFTRVSGPGWLTLDPDGALHGVPLAADAGRNVFVVTLEDTRGYAIDRTVVIEVAGAAPEVPSTTLPGQVVLVAALTAVAWRGGRRGRP